MGSFGLSPRKVRSPEVGGACHVLRVRIAGDGTPLSAWAPTLPSEALAELAEVVAASPSGAELAENLPPTIQRLGCGPVAVLLTPLSEQHFPTPSPLVAPLAPTPLDGRAPALKALLAGRPQPPTDDALIGEERPKWWNRAEVRMGVPLLIAAALLAQAAVQIFVYRQLRFLLVVIGVAILALAPLMPALARGWQRWLLVAGGVLVQRCALAIFPRPAETFRPADTLLIVRDLSRDWLVQLWRDGHCTWRRATTPEVAALLCAWQSPLPSTPFGSLEDVV